jgi:hypothetical protein
MGAKRKSQITVERPERRHLDTERRIIFEWALKKLGFEVMNWTGSEQGSVEGSCNTTTNLRAFQKVRNLEIT